MKIRISFAVLVFLIFKILIFYESVFASPSEDFTTICKTKYLISENGTANVTQEISLINKKPNLYVSEYRLKLTEENIQNLKGWDKMGPLKTKLFIEGGTTNISVSFNEKIVGEGQTLSFIIKYEIPKFVKKKGRLSKIILPKLDKENLPDQFSLELRVPSLWGSLAYASVPPNETSKIQNYYVLNFTGKNFLESGVVLEFGEYQIFDFTLIYALQNSEPKNLIGEIPIPPDTNYQIMEYSEIVPNPLNLRVDNDGNWLASFNLLPNSNLEIKVKGKVKIFSSPLNKPLGRHKDLDQYLSPKTYWEVNDPKIQKLVKNLKSPREIYNFVVKTLDYDYERLKEKKKRYGAVYSLDNPTHASCLEFTDLFVTLARAAGIPAREIEGFAFTDNPKLRPLGLTQDVLHAWPEYYDKETSTWRMVDPTWEKTTGGFDYFDNFDMSHFAFVIHGLDSQFPLPPGSFKQKGQSEKSVFVEFGNEFATRETKIDIEFSIPPSNLLKKEITGFLKIKNLGPSAIYNLPIELLGHSFDLNLFQSEIPIILPFAETKINFNVKNIFQILKNFKEGFITLRIGDQEFHKKIDFRPIILKLAINVLIFLLIFLLFILLLNILRIFLKRKK